MPMRTPSYSKLCDDSTLARQEMESATPKAEIVKRRTKKEASSFAPSRSLPVPNIPHIFNAPLSDPAQSPRATNNTAHHHHHHQHQHHQQHQQYYQHQDRTKGAHAHLSAGRALLAAHARGRREGALAVRPASSCDRSRLAHSSFSSFNTNTSSSLISKSLMVVSCRVVCARTAR